MLKICLKLFQYLNKEVTAQTGESMKIICQKDNLVQGALTAQRCISSRAPLPVLNGILLIAQDNCLTFQATDLDLAIECSLPAEIINPGTVVVPARHFSDIVRRLPNQSITLEYNSESRLLTLTYDSAEFSLNTYNPDEFPNLPAKPVAYHLEIPQQLLKKVISQVAFAASADPIRPIFTGVLMEIAEEQLLFVATDTHRLARRVVSDLKILEINQPFKTIIPARALIELNRLLIDEDTPVKITVNDNHLAFYTDEFYFYTKPIQGVYPDHRKVLPTNFQNEISIEINNLLPSIERAVLMVSTKDGTSIVHLTVNPTALTINSASADLGAVHEEIPITNNGETLNISFNTKYLLDSLKNMPSKIINLKFSGQLSPCIITPISEEDYLYLLLPVRS